MNNSQLTKTLIEALRSSEDSKTTGYDTAATVKRIENGVAWVHIPGGVDETPAKLTINASVGDVVQVRVSGGRAFLVGNGSAPPTDDTTALNATKTANKAHRTALQASEEATEAWNYAGTAAEAAVSAKTSADSAATAASNAWDHAEEARLSAISANNSANNALVQLSVVEDVAGTLRWISEHGSFVPTTDTTVIEGSVYFIYENGDYVPIANPDPNANPSREGWYVLDVTESQAKYIMAHLAVTSVGLWVLPVNQLAEHPLVDSNGDQLVDSNDNPLVDFSADPQHASGYKVLLSGTGMSVFNDEGAVVANYGSTTTIGEPSGYNVYITNNNLQIRNGSTVLARYGATVALGENGDVQIGTSSTGTVAESFSVDSSESSVSITVAHTIAGLTRITGMGWGESGFEPVTISSSDYTRSGKTIIINNPPSGSTVSLSSVFVYYVTTDKVTQLAIGVNYLDTNGINFPFVVGNNNYDLDPENVFSVAWNGEVRSRGHNSYIGEIVRASSSFDSNIAAGIDLYQNVASMTLTPGTWVVFAQFGVSPTSSGVSGCLALRFCVGGVGSSYVVDQARQLGNANTSYFSAINATTILTIENGVTDVYAIASCHYAGTVSARDFKAVCIS